MTKQYMWWIRGLITVGPWARPDSIKMPPLSLASPDIDWKCCCSVAKSSLTWRRHGLQHACLPCLSLSPGVCSNSCPLSWKCYLTSHLHLLLLLSSVFPSIKVFSSSHVWMWELYHKEGWVLKNGCFRIVVLEKTLESPLDCKEIKPINPKGYQPWILIRNTDAEVRAPILWPSDLKSQLI